MQGRSTTPEAHINYVDNHALALPKTPTPAKESRQTTQSDKKFEIPLPSIGALLLLEVQALPSLLHQSSVSVGLFSKSKVNHQTLVEAHPCQ